MDKSNNELKSKSEVSTIHCSSLQNTSNELHRHETQDDCKEINLQIKDSSELDQFSEKSNKEESTVKMETKVNLYSRNVQSSGVQEIDVTGQPGNKFTTENISREPTQVRNNNEKETCLGSYMKLLKNFKFILLILFVLFFASAEGIIYILFPSYFIVKGSTKEQVVLFFTLIGIASTLSRFLTGLILNKNILSLTVLFSVPSFLLSICSYVVPYFSHIYWGQLIYCLLYGVLNFSVYALINKICIVTVGIEGTAPAMGMLMFSWGTAALIGSPFTGKHFIIYNISLYITFHYIFYLICLIILMI